MEELASRLQTPSSCQSTCHRASPIPRCLQLSFLAWDRLGLSLCFVTLLFLKRAHSGFVVLFSCQNVC